MMIKKAITKKALFLVLSIAWVAPALATDSLVYDALYLVEDRMGAKCEQIRLAGEMKSPKICSMGGDLCRGTDTFRCVSRDGESVATVKARYLYQNDRVIKLRKLSIQLD